MTNKPDPTVPKEGEPSNAAVASSTSIQSGRKEDKEVNEGEDADEQTKRTKNAASVVDVADPVVPNMTLLDITEGDNDRGIPQAKFIEDVAAFSATFEPEAPAELLIGGYSELMTKYRTFEAQLQQRQLRLKQKVPELEKSLSLVRILMEKQQQYSKDDDKEEDGDDDDDHEEEDGAKPSKGKGIARFSLADNIYAKAEIDYKNNNTVNLWLGANVMLEFTYQEAVDFLSLNQERAKKEYKETLQDLAFVRDQIVSR